MLADGDRCRLSFLGIAVVLAAAVWVACSTAVAQVQFQGQPMSREQAEAMMRARRGATSRGNAQPPQPEQPKKDEKKKEEKKDDADKKKEEGSASIKRPEKPPRVPDPRELKVSLDKDGRVPPFAFVGQPWPDVLQWLANLSGSSLDWQELPSDYLNLTTKRSYTLERLRNLINRHLHARGYTMLQGGEVLSVFKIEKLDPSLVRRVTEDGLYDLQPYDFAKVSFELPEKLAPDKAAEDVKQVLSPHAKVFPLVSTRRLLVIDAVANLRLVSALLNEERAEQEGRIIPREFVLKYARAEQVIDILYVVLGLDPKSRPTQMQLQLQQQRLQLMMQMQQRGTDVSKMLKTDDGPPVFLAFNRQRNSVLVNAPPEQMRIIERAIRALDVPAGGENSAGESAAGEGRFSGAADATQRQFKKYQLVTLDPANLMMTLEEIGGLNPWTELRADTKSKTLFVRASAADHAKIASLIDQLDGTGRQFEVIYLHRLPADAVAATIFNLMVGQEEEEEENNQPWYWGRRNRQQQEEEKPNKGFRVDADIENNRLLLWANDAEYQEVCRLLVKLGEAPRGASDPRTVRFLEPANDAARERLLEQLRSTWPTVGENELIIKQPVSPEKPARQDDKMRDAEEAAEPAEDPSARLSRPAGLPALYAQLEVAPAERAEGRSARGESDSTDDSAGAPPVTITVTDDGRLMISSRDTQALDRLEELMGQMSPPERRFKVFRLKYITALNMYWNLTDFFTEELSGQQEYMMDWWGRYQRVGDKAGAAGLGQRRKLQIIYDTPSNTILVANASSRQLNEVEQLIDEYDRPAPADSIKSRRTAAIKIRYSRASVIAAALKDVYRDLLSSRDKEFDAGDKRQQSANQERVTVIRYGSSTSDDGTQRPSPVKVGFEGALSVGVDEISNMIIVSVQEELFDSVVRMVKQLDEEAAPKTTVYVHKVDSQINPAALQKALSEAVGTPWPGGRPEKQPEQAAGQSKQPEENGRANENRRNNRG